MTEWLNGLKDEFYLNFIDDDRWKYLLNGLGNTIKITLVALLLGIIIGVLIAVVRSTWDKNSAAMRPGAGRFFLMIADRFSRLYLTVIREPLWSFS